MARRRRKKLPRHAARAAIVAVAAAPCGRSSPRPSNRLRSEVRAGLSGLSRTGAC
ncbi:putative lipoprotein [Mycobacterium kansasii 662]|uniref:Putative lipoprotein n=1 Tax=Mycobacterium kansasii 662 TaxID=1299326 RepID=X7ZBH0_MYCKA|nr:putative lipoprotein [Mycobacterium kansasii 662]